MRWTACGIGSGPTSPTKDHAEAVRRTVDAVERGLAAVAAR